MSTDVQTPPPVRPVAELREVQGPSALGGGSRRFFDLLKLISVTEFKRVYFGTVLGYLWSLLRPLMLFGVLLLVFTQVFRVGSNKVEYYPVFLLMGIVLYTFFSEATGNAVTSVVSQEGVVRKTQFPRAVIPLATVITSLFNLILNLIIVLVFILAFGVSPAWSWLLFPVALAFLFVGTAGMAMALSALYVRFRDTAIIWVVAAQVFLYLTPILYPVNALGEETKERLLMINPLSVIFEQVRVWVLHESQAPTAVQAAGGWAGLIPAAVIYVGVVAFGAWYFNREAPRIAEAL
ncbi:MAG TPA: ABC transporter permease [Solirubrobacterales bacterium]|jgi:ABC-2 type transport system permease protein|nr:ABC transporter permease [Solirubrobacterales bacterium]